MVYFFDTYAVVEMIDQNPDYLKFKDETIITNTLNLAEIYYFLIKNYNEQTANHWMKNLNFEFIDIAPEVSVEAAMFRYTHKKLKFSYADCIGYLMAVQHNLKFLTGDKSFKSFENVEFVGKKLK